VFKNKVLSKIVRPIRTEVGDRGCYITKNLWHRRHLILLE